MLTLTLVCSVAVGASVAAVVKTKKVFDMIGNACPTHCILDEQAS